MVHLAYNNMIYGMIHPDCESKIVSRISKKATF